MVKRKKPSPTLDDDKRENDGSFQRNSIFMDGIETINDAQIPSAVSTNSVKNRTHVTRTCTKEVQIVNSDCTEIESSGSPPEKFQKTLSGQRSSNRIPKRNRKESISIDATIKKPSIVALKQNGPLQSKARRSWELWSVEDKDAFFEAVCEFGKDFENIQSYIAQRSKKKGTPQNMIKNKDQVRHFYYRTWHKISKFLEIKNGVNKHTQEIYGLINYAELRKKIGGCLNEKNRQKLNELVFNGVTTVKYKGKKLRIKTPVCRALKKLNQVAEPKVPDEEKLPKEIILELRPHANRDWLYVQNLAQNPRVRTKVPLQHRLKSVIEYLQRRWQPHRLKKKGKICSALSQFDSSIFHDDFTPQLRLKMRNEIPSLTVTISALDSASSSDVCLEKYMKSTKDTGVDKESIRAKKNKLKPKIQNESAVDICRDEQMPARNSDLNDEAAVISFDKGNVEENYSTLLSPPASAPDSDDCNDNPVDEVQRSLTLLTSMLYPDGKDFMSSKLSPDHIEIESSKILPTQGSVEFNPIEEMYLNTCPNGEKLTLGELLSQRIDPLSPQPEEEKNENSIDKPFSPSSINIHGIESDDFSCMRDGWTVDTAGLITIGELYLMVGRPEIIKFEYEFEDPKQPIDQDVLEKSDKELEVKSHEIDNLTDLLKKLLKTAVTAFSEFKNKQAFSSSVCRTANQSRINPSSQSSNKTNPRCISRNSNLKSNLKSKSTMITKDSVLSVSDLSFSEKSKVSNVELCSTTDSLRTVISDHVSSSSDKHVFVVPVGTAPRTMKKPSQESLKEEMDKLLPSNRRGCRVRRKPLVVQRPLLPRDGVGTVSGPRPMTVVHFVPSGPPLTTMIPSNTATESKTNLLPAKKVVKFLSTGTAIDMRPLQVPVVKQVSADSRTGVILQQGTIPATHLMVTQPISQNISHQTLESMINKSSNKVDSLVNVEKNTMLISSNEDTQPSVDNVSALTLSLPQQEIESLATVSVSSSNVHEAIVASSPPRISIPDTQGSSSSNLSPRRVPSFLEISLSENLSSKNVQEDAHTSLLSFPNNQDLSVFGISSSSSVKSSSEHISSALSSLNSDSVIAQPENTPPQSPSRPFRINSPGPEAQWLNGESVELSLSSLLNTLESPSKILSMSSSSISLGNDNSNLDPIGRLAPVVDSQVRCLLEECSVDFITKFEDLADVINSSNTDSKQA